MYLSGVLLLLVMSKQLGIVAIEFYVFQISPAYFSQLRKCFSPIYYPPPLIAQNDNRHIIMTN